MLFIATFLVNSATQLIGSALIFFMPYIVGTGKFAMSSGNFHIYAPINVGFTSTFAVAIMATALGIASRIYQKRISSV